MYSDAVQAEIDAFNKSARVSPAPRRTPLRFLAEYAFAMALGGVLLIVMIVMALFGKSFPWVDE